MRIPTTGKIIDATKVEMKNGGRFEIGGRLINHSCKRNAYAA